MTYRRKLSRRTFLRGVGLSGATISIGLPAFEAMFNANGTAYAAEGELPAQPIETRFVLWFNGNGIIEKYWIPRQDGEHYEITPCLKPLARFRNDIHILSGVDNAAARSPGPGNGHHKSMSGLVSCEGFSGRGAGGPSIDQVIAQHIGGESRFRSLQIGVCQESFGESVQRNMSWAGRDRPLPPEMIPHRLFDSLFGSKEEYWIDARKASWMPCARRRRHLSRTWATAISSGWKNIWLRCEALNGRSLVCRRNTRRWLSNHRLAVTSKTGHALQNSRPICSYTPWRHDKRVSRPTC